MFGAAHVDAVAERLINLLPRKPVAAQHLKDAPGVTVEAGVFRAHVAVPHPHALGYAAVAFLDETQDRALLALFAAVVDAEAYRDGGGVASVRHHEDVIECAEVPALGSHLPFAVDNDGDLVGHRHLLQRLDIGRVHRHELARRRVPGL